MRASLAHLQLTIGASKPLPHPQRLAYTRCARRGAIAFPYPEHTLQPPLIAP
jgi:hypothetical protein